jgi:hypothetical protein
VIVRGSRVETPTTSLRQKMFMVAPDILTEIKMKLTSEPSLIHSSSLIVHYDFLVDKNLPNNDIPVFWEEDT